MKRLLFAATIALAATGSALAADLPPPIPAPPPRAPAAYVPIVVPQYNWGGVYIGINGGYAFGDSNWGYPASSGNFDIDGGLVGATVGANFQSGPVVFGVEGDIDWTDIQGSISISCGGPACTPETSNDWLGTVRGRVGYAFDRVLVYGTAGGAFGDVKATVTPAGGTTTSNDNTEFGWTAGGGVEVAITENLTAKVEYLFVDLSNGSIACGAGCPVSSIPVSFEASLARAGLNFKFGGF